MLAAGKGTRMRERASDARLTGEQTAAADAGLKMLVPIHGRPYLAYVLHELADAGFDEAVLVVGPGPADPVRAAADELGARRLRLRCIEQASPRGVADAVLAAEPAVGADPFLVINADNIYPAHVLAGVASLEGPGLAAFDAAALVARSNIPADRLRSFALIEARDGWLVRVVEKPDAASASALTGAPVSMTCWRFDASIFDACRAVAPSPRGELELPAAVELAVARGTRFRVVPVEAGVLDLSTRADIPALERLLARRTPCP